MIELSRKNNKLEEKLKTLEFKVGTGPEKSLSSKGTVTEPLNDDAFSKEKIFHQTEYLRRLNQPAYERVTLPLMVE